MENPLHACKSCSNEFSGSYCNVCGEKVIQSKDRKLIYFLGELINAFSFADSKLWKTLKTIHLSPGKFSKDFVEGKRRRYMKPVSVFFLANLLYFLFPMFNTFTSTLRLQMSAFFHSEIVTEIVERELEENEMDFREYEAIYNAQTEELSKLFLIIMSGLLALFFWPIHIGSKKSLLADHITLGLEIMVFILLFCLMFIVLFLEAFSFVGLNLVSDQNLTILALVSLLYFFMRAERTFYGFKGFRMIFNAFGCIGAVAVSVTLYRAILFFITFWSL